MLAVLPASGGVAGPSHTWESPGPGQAAFRRDCDTGFFFSSFPRHPLIENDPMQLSAWRPLVSTPRPVPSTEILAVMTADTYAQEDTNSYLFAPDKKVLESAASGSWRLAVLLVTRDPHAPCSFTDGSKHQPARWREGQAGQRHGLGRGALLPCYRS